MKRVLIVVEETEVEEVGTIEELLLAKNQLEVINKGYKDLSLSVPKWVLDKHVAIDEEIRYRIKAELQRKLKIAETRRSQLRTADEKRRDLDAEIAELKKAIG